MSPGPVSSSYDPEFGTGEAADDVRNAVTEVRDLLTTWIKNPEELHNIVELARADDRHRKYMPPLTQRELRILRFALNRALETI